ncbi:hypothetical protein WMF38_14740 [Sorangium sp. So ce118]
MPERHGTTDAGATTISYDAPTAGDEVFGTLRRLVGEDAEAGRTRVIYVISGTHGDVDGTVTPEMADVSFKHEDLGSAGITRSNINIRNYHETAPNRWIDLGGKGENAVLVLAWCYSYQWLSNVSGQGNNQRIVMR